MPCFRGLCGLGTMASLQQHTPSWGAVSSTLAPGVVGGGYLIALSRICDLVAYATAVTYAIPVAYATGMRERLLFMGSAVILIP